MNYKDYLNFKYPDTPVDYPQFITKRKGIKMSELIAGNSVIKNYGSDVLAAVHTDTILDAVNTNGVNGVQTTQNVGLAADATAQRMAIAELGAIDRVSDEVCDSSRDEIAATERLGLENLRASERAGDRAVASNERLGLFNNSAIERTADKTQDEVEKFGLRELDAINSSERHIYAGMSQNAKDLLMFNSNGFDRIRHQQYEDTKQLLLQNCHDTESIKSQSAGQFKDILLQNCGDTASIKMQAEVLAKDAALAARDIIHLQDKNTAAIQLEAYRHKEELARQIAECCCENKALIIEKASHTDALIRSLDENRVKDQLQEARFKILALENKIPTVTVAA